MTTSVYAVNSDEWYPVYDPFVMEEPHGHHYTLDNDLVCRYIAARNAHRTVLDELDKAMDEDWLARRRQEDA